MNWYQSKHTSSGTTSHLFLLSSSSPAVLMLVLAELFPFKSRPSSNQVIILLVVEGRRYRVLKCIVICLMCTLWFTYSTSCSITTCGGNCHGKKH